MVKEEREDTFFDFDEYGILAANNYIIHAGRTLKVTPMTEAPLLVQTSPTGQV